MRSRTCLLRLAFNPRRKRPLYLNFREAVSLTSLPSCFSPEGSNAQVIRRRDLHPNCRAGPLPNGPIPPKIFSQKFLRACPFFIRSSTPLKTLPPRRPKGEIVFFWPCTPYSRARLLRLSFLPPPPFFFRGTIPLFGGEASLMKYTPPWRAPPFIVPPLSIFFAKSSPLSFMEEFFPCYFFPP